MAARAQLTAFIKRKLGAPVNHIEMSANQYTDIIDEALNYFYYYGTGASTKEAYLALAVQEDVATYDIDEDVMGIARFMPDESSEQGVHTLFTVENYMYNTGNLDFLLGGSSMSMVGYALAQQQIALSNHMLRGKYTIEVIEAMHQIVITPTPTSDFAALIKCHQKIDEEYILDHRWVRQYSVALATIQWSQNVGKFSNIVFPGGAQFNVVYFAEKAEARKVLLEEQLRTDYEEPPFFMIG